MPRKVPATGETVTFANAQFAIPPGDRYALELRIVRTADGVHSRAIMQKLRRR